MDSRRLNVELGPFKDIKMQSRLSLMIMDNGDGSGELTVKFATDGFSSQGSAWFNLEKLYLEFEAFACYPIDPANPPSVSGGFFGRDGAVKEECVGLNLVPFGPRGHVMILVRLSCPDAENFDPRCKTFFSGFMIVEYQQLSDFVANIKKLLESSVDEVLLFGDKR